MEKKSSLKAMFGRQRVALAQRSPAQKKLDAEHRAARLSREEEERKKHQVMRSMTGGSGSSSSASTGRPRKVNDFVLDGCMYSSVANMLYFGTTTVEVPIQVCGAAAATVEEQVFSSDYSSMPMLPPGTKVRRSDFLRVVVIFTFLKQISDFRF